MGDKVEADTFKVVTTKVQKEECAKRGINIPFDAEVIDDESLIDFVICPRIKPAPMFSDNLYGSCSKCGAAIMFRPTAPKGPAKICIPCAAGLIPED